MRGCPRLVDGAAWWAVLPATALTATRCRELCPGAVKLGTWQCMWIKADVTGIAPPPRSGHTATAITDKQMAVFGGACGASFFSDLHILDMSASCGHACAWPRRTPSLTANARARLRHGCADRRNWSRVMTRGVPPTPRHGHCATLVGSDSDKTPPMVRCIRAPRARVLGVRNIVSPACVCTRAAGRVWRHCFSEQPAALPQGPVPVRPRCVRPVAPAHRGRAAPHIALLPGVLQSHAPGPRPRLVTRSPALATGTP